MEDINFAQPSLVGEDAVQLLRNGVITQTLGLVPWGSNHTLLVIVTANNMSALCIYKPRKGERPLWDFPDGTLCQRETAAYEVSKAIGWDIVPPTVLREGPYGTGSFQWFVEHDPGANYFTFGPEMESQLQHVALFDHIINNADRKGGHCLLDNDGRIWAIDHGVCFSVQPKIRTVIWDFAGQQIAAGMLESITKLQQKLNAADGQFRGEIEPLLSSAEVEALKLRVDSLLRYRTYPEPGPGRSYPWPPV